MDKVKRFKEIANELGNLYEKKNNAYGDSFSDTFYDEGMAMPRIRIGDKFRRFRTLTMNPSIDNFGESVEDTLRDMANYCIMTIIELENIPPIKKGMCFLCTRSVVIDDCPLYIEGSVYRSDMDGAITNEEGNIEHWWKRDYINHFCLLSNEYNEQQNQKKD